MNTIWAVTSYTSNGGNRIHYDYDRLNGIVEKSYEDVRDPENKEGVLYGYDVLGQRVSMMDRSGESKYEYDGLGRITKVTSGSGEVTRYAYDGSDQLEGITYADGKKVSYEYDKNDNLVKVTDRTGAETTYVYDAINRVTEIHRPNGVSTYNTYNARDQITDMRNICDDCGWVISEYHYTYDDRGFIVGEDVTESLYAYAWDDKHDGKHENWHDDKYPHGDKHINKHAKDGIYNFQIIGTKRAFEYDDDGKLTKATETEDRQGTYVYEYGYDDMGNRTSYKKSRNGKVQESAEYTYNLSNQMVAARLYDGKHYKDVEYTYDADGNRTMQEEVKADGDRKVELTYDYSVENRLKAVHDKNDLLVAMAYDGDGNRIFQLNYNLHTDDDWKGNSGNGNGNNKDNSGSGNSGNSSGNGTGSKGLAGSFLGLFTDGGEEAGSTDTTTTRNTSLESKGNKGNKDKDKGNDGNDKNNGKGNGNGNSGNNGNGGSGNDGNGNSGNNGNTSTGGSNDNNGNANGNTNNTGGSQNQSGILFPIDGEVSELESELIGMIKTTGKEKNYELVEYVNDVNREHTEVLMELNINGIMDTAYSYGNERLTNERFTGWTGYYTYDPRGSVTGVTDDKGMIWQSYRYNANGDFTFGKPQYNNVYSYNAESYNPNMESQYLRARYYNVPNANFLTEDSYLGNITDPLTLNRYNYVKSSPLNYIDPSGHLPGYLTGESWDDDPFPYGAGPQAEWYRRNYPELTSEQSKALERIKDDISTADKLSVNEDCDIIRISESAWEYLTNAMLGAFVSIIKSGGDPYRVYAEAFWKVFGIDRDFLAEGNAQAEYIEDVLVTNKTAYYVGKIVGDVVAIILGVYTIIQGIKGTVAGAIGSLAATSSGQVYIVPAGVAVTAAGIAVTTTGAGVAISAFSDLNNTGNKLREENKGDSDPYNISDESKEKWGKGTFDSTEDSLKYHFKEHGEEVGAKDIDQYVRKAEGFSQNLKGASKSYPDNGTPGATRYTKNGKYIIIGPDGKILSYGLAR